MTMEKQGVIRHGLTPPEKKARPGEKQAELAELAGSAIKRLADRVTKGTPVTGK